jgi:hypothetical protein
MKVKELIKLLQQEDQEAEVIMSKDGEGNSFSPFSDFGTQNCYKAECTWSGEMGFSELTPELEKDGYGEGDIISDGVPALVLYPVN